MKHRHQNQSIPKHLRYTRNQFDQDFPDDDACLEQIKEQRFPGGVAACKKCKVDRKHYRVTGRTAYACDHCGNHIYPLAGTIFEKSSTSLRIWFQAMYLMGSTRCGISAKQIQRETGVTYKTAWRMFKQIRSLLSDPDTRLEGSTVEIDETGIGGVTKRKNTPLKEKISVLGMVERGGRVVAMVVPDRKKMTMWPVIRQYVMPKSAVFTDDYASYEGLDVEYNHRRINHSAGVYVMGDCHTQTIEGFWSLVKRGIGGVYHSVSAKYLQTYLNEYSFRYNHRTCGNLIFPLILERAGRELSKPSVQVEKNLTV
jgi:transposase